MGVPTSEICYTSATTGRGDHEVPKGYVVALERNIYIYIYIYNIHIYFLYHCRPSPVPLSEYIWLRISSFFRCLSGSIIHLIPVSLPLSTIPLTPFLYVTLYHLIFCFLYSLSHFLLFLKHFTCPSLSVIRVILYLSPAFFRALILCLSLILLANSFLRLLPLSLVLVVSVSPSRQFSHQQTTIR
jgi:hypothetical protein